MTPYDVLELAPDASIDEAEAAYHRLIRQHHPDLHQADGPDAIAAAEARTRALNTAIDRVRAEFAARQARASATGTGPEGATGGDPEGAAGPRGSASAAGFGDPADPSHGHDRRTHDRTYERRRAAEEAAWTEEQAWRSATGSFADPPPVVACPYCDTGCAGAAGLKVHVFEAHGLRIDPAPRPARRQFIRWSRVTHTTLWVLAPLNAIVATMIALLASSLDSMFALWVFAVAMTPTFIGFMAYSANRE